MTPNARMQKRGLQAARAVKAIGPLVKRDRTRRIDRIIDYFGGTGFLSRAGLGDWRVITRSIAAAHLEGGVR